MQRTSIFLIVAMLVSMMPIQLSAQLVQNGAGYGQALGERRSQARPLNMESAGMAGSSDNQLDDQAQGMMRSTGRRSAFDHNSYQIHILGQVRMPGTYRLPPSTRMAEAIEMAGGIGPRGSMRKIELKRNNRTVRTYDLNAFLYEGHLDQNPFLLDNDEIFIPFAQKVVSVQGPVNKNGVIELTNEASLSDVVKLANGYSVGILKTDPVTVIRYVNGKKVVSTVEMNPEDMGQFEVHDGDVIVFPHQLTKGRKFDYNIAKLPNDTLFYPSYNDNIFVMGAVSQPGAYPFNPFYDVRNYVNMAGPVRYASLKHMKILDANNKEVKYKEGYILSPGDTVIVPYKSWTTDNVLKWYNTLSSTVFTGFALQQLIKQQ